MVIAATGKVGVVLSNEERNMVLKSLLDKKIDGVYDDTGFPVLQYGAYGLVASTPIDPDGVRLVHKTTVGLVWRRAKENFIWTGRISVETRRKGKVGHRKKGRQGTEDRDDDGDGDDDGDDDYGADGNDKEVIEVVVQQPVVAT